MRVLAFALLELSHPFGTVWLLPNFCLHNAVKLNFQGDLRVLECQVCVQDQAVYVSPNVRGGPPEGLGVVKYHRDGGCGIII